MTSPHDTVDCNDLLPKKYVVWYRAGAGGFFVAWLLQLALDDRYLETSLRVFPECLSQDPQQWKRYEKTPSSVAVLCNPFHPDPFHTVEQEQEIRDVIELVLSGDSSSMDNLLYCRIKMYLCNFVYKTGNITKTQLDNTIQDPQKWQLEKILFVKAMTDVLFDQTRNIFLQAPERYCDLAAKHKGFRFYPTSLDGIVSQYHGLKKFNLETVWQGHWVQELESIIDTELTARSKYACQQLVTRYLDVMPGEMKTFCKK